MALFFRNDVRKGRDRYRTYGLGRCMLPAHTNVPTTPAPSCNGNCPIGGERQPGQFGKRPRARPFHDLGAMIFDGPLADVEIRSDVLAGMAGEDPLHDVMLPMGKTREALVGSFT